MDEPLASGRCGILNVSPFCYPLCSRPRREYTHIICISKLFIFCQVIFQITPLNYIEWQAVLAFSLPVVMLDEILKACARIYSGKIVFLFFTLSATVFCSIGQKSPCGPTKQKQH